MNELLIRYSMIDRLLSERMKTTLSLIDALLFILFLMESRYFSRLIHLKLLDGYLLMDHEHESNPISVSRMQLKILLFDEKVKMNDISSTMDSIFMI